MFSVKQDMDIRLLETDELINLIGNIESGLTTSPAKINTPILRASVVLSLYNIIESTVTNTLTRIHDEINSNKVNYNNLSKEIKDLAIIYFYKHKEKRADIHDSMEALHHTLDLLRGKGYFEIPYSQMMESYQLYSGNLDARSIRKVMKKYGITISEQHGKHLKNIKDGRNTLSHGNKSFEEFGRDLVILQLENYKDDVKKFLTEVITESQSFITGKKFKAIKAVKTTSRKKR